MTERDVTPGNVDAELNLNPHFFHYHFGLMTSFLLSVVLFLETALFFGFCPEVYCAGVFSFGICYSVWLLSLVRLRCNNASTVNTARANPVNKVSSRKNTLNS